MRDRNVHFHKVWMELRETNVTFRGKAEIDFRDSTTEIVNRGT